MARFVSSSSPVTAADAPHLRRGRLPAWVASIWFHLVLLVAASVGLRSCTGPGQRGEADGDWKTVGLVTRMQASDNSRDTESPTADALTPLEATDLPPSDLAAVDAPPVALPDLPGADLPPILGPGAGIPRFTAATDDSPLTPSGAAPPTALARGETGFFGMQAEGKSVVYVIDISGSMSSPPTAIAAAKAELMSSLESLSSDQEFQIIFYNERPHLLQLEGQPPRKLYPATAINRTLARQKIASVQTGFGTVHLPALRAAFELKPDVIFFLTDADDITAKLVEDIRRLNAGGARIHCVEFGQGARLRDTTPMERIAQQNGGAYQYRDVMRLGR
jgi:hypothetical protein